MTTSSAQTSPHCMTLRFSCPLSPSSVPLTHLVLCAHRKSHILIWSPGANVYTYQVLLLPQRRVYLKQVFQVKAADTQVNIYTERSIQGSKSQKAG